MGAGVLSDDVVAVLDVVAVVAIRRGSGISAPQSRVDWVSNDSVDAVSHPLDSSESGSVSLSRRRVVVDGGAMLAVVVVVVVVLIATV